MSSPERAVAWHAQPVAAVLSTLKTTPAGLGAEEAALRRAAQGPNAIPAAAAAPWWRLLLGQLASPLIWVLLASGGVAFALGERVDAGVVFGVVVLNTLVGFVQELRASRAIEALSSMVPEYASVLRAGVPETIDARLLVTGDVLLLTSGDRVPADLRLIDVHELKVDESILTGESVPAEKAEPPVDADAGIADRRCVAFSGTLVTQGTGRGVVVAIGHDTQLGHISGLIAAVPSLETPLTTALARLSSQIALAVLGLAALMIGLGTWRLSSEGLPLIEAFKQTIMFAIALAVGAVPEGLPATVTIALAVGVRRMAARSAIIRNLPAVETLGATSIICSDKTGTLTKNEMTLVELWSPTHGSFKFEGAGYALVGVVHDAEGRVVSEGPLRAILAAAVRVSDAGLPAPGAVFGDPTEVALVVGAAKLGLDAQVVRAESPRLDVVPFESERRLMAVAVTVDGAPRIELKGAPEVLLPRSAPELRARAEPMMTGFGERGLRVLALATAPPPPPGEALADWIARAPIELLGLAAMADPVRPEAVEAVARARSAGISVKMITGDHPATAWAIGGQLGLTEGLSLADGVVTGRQLAATSDAELPALALASAVFARVEPEHKLRLVRALQSTGAIVAMTGDGVNDGPALEQADIGVAMGKGGSSVAREAADVVLTDDNFATIVVAVEEGRRVYDNLVKSLVFILPTNLGLAFILGVALLFFPFDPIVRAVLLPVRPTQILWLNLVCAVTLALPLAFEGPEVGVMARGPRSPRQPILTRFLIIRTLVVASLMTGIVVGLFLFVRARLSAGGIDADEALHSAQTAAVHAVVGFQCFYLLCCRALRGPIFSVAWRSNPLVFAGIGTLLGLELLLGYAPPLQAVFATRALDPLLLLLSLSVGVLVLPLMLVERRWVKPAIDR